MRKIRAASCGCGHRATRKGLLAPHFDRSLHPPAGRSEAICLNIPGHIHFNKHVEDGGATVFFPP
ncbi:MAG: hypothetical protein M3067_04900 [Chloroflexota bacterium]|nr:hypothetical protein [Chloroflexota bacterium]